MSEPIPFATAARIPAPGDNVAIAVKRLDAGTLVDHEGGTFSLPHTVLEGHRFVLEPIAKGGELASWGLPFGVATRDLVAGEYVCNQSILEVLAERSVDVSLPDEPVFTDHLETYSLDEQHFRAGEQVARAATPLTFAGYPRPGRRGVGTRNFIVVLATTSHSTAFAEALAKRFADAGQNAGLDGVVAVTHTEGGGVGDPNNLDFVLRTLAGFIVHANVGAALVVNYAGQSYGNDDVREFMVADDYPLADVPHEFVEITGDFASELDRCESVVRAWLPEVGATQRTEAPLSELKVALQCGGSDAFSGVSGNPLAGWVAKQIIANGGSANLAETDELIGAEPYILSNVRDIETARAFLHKIEVFKERAHRHGANAEGNPSGGNKLRGLYNIALKSIGAARKRDPDVRLDYVLDYAEPMQESGYYFMDSPGNDLESIAGQVAAGSNLIFFITGNGSITNFPFVPTLKFVTTSGRFSMLANEMDVNAGRLSDGETLEDVGGETFELTRQIASGSSSKGELAGHSQVQIWRDWRQTEGGKVAQIRKAPVPDGAPLEIRGGPPATLRFDGLKTERGFTCEQIGLVMPTSLCSGQVARLIAEELNGRADAIGSVSRYVALVHTEGCGSANAEHLYLQTLLGHLRHRFTKRAVLLEHGCERTHNDAVRRYLHEQGLGTERFGWASVQLDGGIAGVRDKVVQWFEEALSDDPYPGAESVGVEELRLGVFVNGRVSDRTAETLARVMLGVVNGGGTVVIPAQDDLLGRAVLRETLLREPADHRASLAYGQPAERAGLHIMQAPTQDSTEIITGLGGTGVEIMLGHLAHGPLQAHPMIPLLQVSGEPQVKAHYAADLDLLLDNDAPIDALVERMLTCIGEAASRRYQPKLFGRGITNFQLTRGLLGVSL